MTPDCERFEMEIGMRSHGVLEAAEVAALDAHLAGCESCRRFSAAAFGAEATVKEGTAAEAARVDWEALSRRVHGVRRAYRLKLALAPLFLLQTPLIYLMAAGRLPEKEMLLIAPPITVAIYLAYVWLVSRPFREVLAVVKNGDDLLRGYRRELLRQRLRARIFAGVNLALAAVGLAEVVLMPPAHVAGLLVVVLLLALWAAYDLGIKLPRLRRALGEVDP